MDTIPERLDWLWFLGYDLDDDTSTKAIVYWKGDWRIIPIKMTMMNKLPRRKRTGY